VARGCAVLTATGHEVIEASQPGKTGYQSDQRDPGAKAVREIACDHREDRIVKRGSHRNTKTGPYDEKYREAVSLRPKRQHRCSEDRPADHDAPAMAAIDPGSDGDRPPVPRSADRSRALRSWRSGSTPAHFPSARQIGRTRNRSNPMTRVARLRAPMSR